ncbi:MAG: phosphoribosylanthranilate isomerase [Pseudomonadota bacterium]
MPVQIKICGLSTPETIAAAARAGASHIGFNFYPPSPRFVSVAKSADLAEQTPDNLLKVGVYVDPDDALLEESVVAARLNAIQLHGKEDAARIAAVKSRFGLPVWKVLSVETAEDVVSANDYANADFLLFDTKTPAGAQLPGGMGLSFDWSLLKAFEGVVPWGLAGGLKADNVADAIRSTGTALVDTSSGVESAPGIKDVDKIAAFCNAALNHD